LLSYRRRAVQSAQQNVPNADGCHCRRTFGSRALDFYFVNQLQHLERIKYYVINPLRDKLISYLIDAWNVGDDDRMAVPMRRHVTQEMIYLTAAKIEIEKDREYRRYLFPPEERVDVLEKQGA